jgi:hypothetical protein
MERNALNLLEAIYDDDLRTGAKLLRQSPSLAKSHIDEAKLYEGKIGHWMYVGDTPLHLAAAGHRFEIVRALLAAGADANSAANHRRGAPLHYAADTCPDSPTFSAVNQTRVLSALIEAGAHINVADKNGATALHRAVRTRGAEAVKFLLKSGADPLLENNSGSTPFHLAVQNTGRGGSGSQAAKRAQREIIEMFMARDVDPTIKRSVMEQAQSPWIRELLR